MKQKDIEILAKTITDFNDTGISMAEYDELITAIREDERAEWMSRIIIPNEEQIREDERYHCEKEQAKEIANMHTKMLKLEQEAREDERRKFANFVVDGLVGYNDATHVVELYKQYLKDTNQ